MKRQFDDGRLCRLRGESPTARERWTAFYRLWRMASHAPNQSHFRDYTDCFRVLMWDWRWISLMEQSGERYGQMPRFLRKLMAEQERRIRLQGLAEMMA